jgi:hypothetical protein
MNAEEIKRQLRGGVTDTSANNVVSGSMKRHVIEQDSDSEEEIIPWEPPGPIDAPCDLDDPELIASFNEPDKYEYTSRQSIRNLRQLFKDAVGVLEEIEFQ